MDHSGVRRRLALASGGVRRAVLVRRRMLSALLAGVAVLALVRAVSPPPAPTTSALVAVRDLSGGAVVGAGDVATEAMPPSAVPADAAVAPVGRTLAGRVAAGEVLAESRFVGPSLIADHAGMVAVPVRIPDADAVALLRVGDRIDLLAADPAAAEPSGVRVLQGSLVLALPTPHGDRLDGERGRLVVLACSPDQAARLAGHAARGVLTIALSG